MFWLIIIPAVLLVLLEITISLLYRYPIRPHEATPAAENIAFEEIRFPTRKGKTLYGWWIAACDEPRPTIILMHGWGQNIGKMLPAINKLAGLGANILAFDLRNHGSSEADTHPNLLKFSEDLRAAVDYITTSRPEAGDKIAVLGFSVGGGAAIHASAHDARISSVVTVGAMARPIDVMRYEMGKRHIPYIPIGWLILRYAELRIGIDFDEIAPVNNIARSRAEILLIHGDQDKVVPVSQAHRLLEAGQPGKVQLWIVEGKGHNDCTYHPEFQDRVEKFLRTTLEL